MKTDAFYGMNRNERAPGKTRNKHWEALTGPAALTG